MKAIPFDEVEFVRLWNEGVNSYEIAKHFGASKGWVISHRDRLGLQPRKPYSAQIPVSKAWAAYEAGASLAEIGKAYGVFHATVARALRAHGYEIRPRKTPEDTVRTVVQMRRRGLSHEQIAARIGMTVHAVGRITRRVLGPTTGYQRVYRDRQRIHPQQVAALIQQGVKGHEVAQMLGCSRSTVVRAMKAWRRGVVK